MNRREIALLATAAVLFAGAAFLVTAPARRVDYLRRAPLEALERESKSRPQESAVWLNLGQKRRGAGKLPEAYEALARAAELAPTDFVAWSEAAALARILYGEQGSFDLLATFVRNNPAEARGHLALASLYLKKKSLDRAVAEANAALKIDPKLPEAWRIIGWERLLNDALEEAESAMRKAVALDAADSRNHVGLGDVLVARARYPDAVAAYRKAHDLSPDDPNAQAMLARAILKTGVADASALAEVETLLRRSLDGDEGRAVTHVALAELFERRGEWPPALQEYETATLLEPGLPDTLYKLSLLHQRLKHPEEFRRWATRHQAMRNFVPLEKALKQKIQEEKRPEEALRLRIELAQKTAAAGMLTSAVAQLQSLPRQESAVKALEQNPLYREQALLSQANAELISQGDERLKADDPARAQSLYFAAVRRNRFHPLALQNVGLALALQNRPKEAALFLRNALQSDPKLSRAHFALGDLARAEGDGGRARGHYEAGLKGEPKNVRAWLILGAICRDGQQESPAREAFSQAYALAPDLPDAAREWAATLEEEGKRDDAESVLRRNLAKAPEGETLAQLAVLRLEKFRDVADAEKLLESARRADPENTYARYGLGLVRIEQKRAREACQLLEPLVVRDPQAREVWFALGKARRDSGDIKGAQQALDTARRLEQQFLQERSK